MIISRNVFQMYVTPFYNCMMIASLYNDIFIFGDANCFPEKSKTVKAVCDVYDLTNLIKTPTYHKGHVST